MKTQTQTVPAQAGDNLSAKNLICCGCFFGAAAALFFAVSSMVSREKFKTRFRLHVVCAVVGTVAAGAVSLLWERWGYCEANGICQYPVMM